MTSSTVLLDYFRVATTKCPTVHSVITNHLAVLFVVISNKEKKWYPNNLDPLLFFFSIDIATILCFYSTALTQEKTMEPTYISGEALLFCTVNTVCFETVKASLVTSSQETPQETA